MLTGLSVMNNIMSFEEEKNYSGVQVSLILFSISIHDYLFWLSLFTQTPLPRERGHSTVLPLCYLFGSQTLGLRRKSHGNRNSSSPIRVCLKEPISSARDFMFKWNSPSVHHLHFYSPVVITRTGNKQQSALTASNPVVEECFKTIAKTVASGDRWNIINTVLISFVDFGTGDHNLQCFFSWKNVFTLLWLKLFEFVFQCSSSPFMMLLIAMK